MTDLPAGSPIDSIEAYAELVEWLPTLLDELLSSPVFNHESRPPPDQRGVYLFSEGRHLYVGRTGITERARAGITTSGTSFRSRFDNHTQPGTPPGTAPFANRLMRERAAELDIEIPTAWWENRKDTTANIYELFTEAKERIAQMECRIAPFLDDERGVRSTVAETYVHAVLGTPYNDFSTS